LNVRHIKNIRHQFADGHTARDLADAYDTYPGKISKIVKGEVYESVGGPIQQGHLRRKLIDDQVREARRRHKEGEPLTDLSLDYPVSQEALRLAINRETYKDVT